MIEVLYMVQLARMPPQAIARRWFCQSIHHVTKRGIRCPDCRDAQD
jgi:hypothetical protein